MHEIKLETQRLELIPLTPEQLAMWLGRIERLEKALDCSYQGEPMEGVFKDIVNGQYEITKRDPEHYLWHSFWMIIRKSDRIAIGSADFKNVPDQNGDVEIGYGLGKPFEHNGYMTETVEAMCSWASTQNGVSQVIAETETDGLASQRILQRCGFTKYSRGATVWWKFCREDQKKL